MHVLRCSVRGWICLWVTLAIVCSRPGWAHPMAADLTLVKMRFHYKMIVGSLNGPALELLEPAGIKATDLQGEETSPETFQKIETWLEKNFTLEQDGQTLKPELTGIIYQPTTQKDNDSYLLDLQWPTPKPAEKLKVTSKFVRTIVATGNVQFELKGTETEREFETKENLQNVWRNVQDFFKIGMEHLFTGTDHILFICTLIFALISFKSAVKMLTGFTVGHSVTLILCTFVTPPIPMRFIESAIYLTIIYVGVENILKKESPQYRWWLVSVFGLVHGMAFSTNLRDIGLPEQGLVLCLLSFNLGIEFAQLVIVALAFPILSRLRWWMEASHSEVGTEKFRRALNFGSGFTACLGIWWLLEALTKK